MTEKPLDPVRVREWEEDTEYIKAVTDDKKITEGMAKLNIEAVLVGIRFIHDYASTSEGEAEIIAALETGFFKIVPGQGDDRNVYAVPRLLWPDALCDKLSPGQSFSASFGMQIGRFMLWGPPGMVEARLHEPIPKRDHTGHAIKEAVRRFKHEKAH